MKEEKGGTAEDFIVRAERLLAEGSCEKAGEFFLRAFESADEDSPDRGDFLHRAAVAFWKAGVFDRAEEVFRSAAAEYRRTGSFLMEARNIMGLGASYRGQKRMSEAYRTMHDALELARNQGDRKLEGEVVNWLGIICRDQGDFNLAKEHNLQALSIFRELDFQEDIASSLNSLGLNHYHLDDLEGAMECFREALEIQRGQESSWGLSDTLNSIGMTLRKMGRLEEALENYTQALQERKRTGGKARIANILNNMGNLYASMDMVDRAIDCHTEALAIREAISSRSGMASSLLNLGEAWKMSGNLHRAAGCLEKSLVCQQNNEPDEQLMDTLVMLAGVRSLQGDSRAAYELQSKALELSRRLYRDQVEKRMAESREILKTEHRVREARMLMDKNRKLEALSRMLASHKEQLQLILDYVPAAIFFIDGSGTLLRLNNYAAGLFHARPRELVGRNAQELFGPMGEPLKPEETEPVLNTEETLSTDDGPRDYLCHRVPMDTGEKGSGGLVVFAVDMTESRRAEKQRLKMREITGRSDLLKTLGSLARILAEEFGDQLTVIRNSLETASRSVADPSAADWLLRAAGSTERSFALCRQLRALSGETGSDFRETDISEEAAFTVRAMTFDPDVKFQFRTGSSSRLPTVELAPAMLRLAVENILSVIEEAVDDREVISVSTGSANADEDYLKDDCSGGQGRPGSYVYLEIECTAAKTADQVRERLDPFFKGDMLSPDLRILALHGVMKSHGGFLSCSRGGGGRVAIRLHFPVKP